MRGRFILMVLVGCKAVRLLLLVCCCLLLAACDTGHTGFSDCDKYASPYIEDHRLSYALLNQDYAESIAIDIDNLWFGGRYNTIVELYGEIPPGISWQSRNRSVRLAGAATAPGIYRFTVSVDVRYRFDDALYYSLYGGYCHFYTSREFELIVYAN